MAHEHAHPFGPEYRNSEAALCYYGHRFYRPGLGRWLSRDPISEEAFFSRYLASVELIERIALLGQYYAGNAYFVVKNHPLDATDSLGLRDETTTGTRYNFAGISNAIGHHHNPRNLPPSDPSRMPSFNYIHYTLQCKDCEQAQPQPSVPSWCKDCQVIKYSAGGCDGKTPGSADMSIGTTWLAQLALNHILALHMATEAALQGLMEKELKFSCTPCKTNGSGTAP